MAGFVDGRGFEVVGRVVGPGGGWSFDVRVRVFELVMLMLMLMVVVVVLVVRDSDGGGGIVILVRSGWKYVAFVFVGIDGEEMVDGLKYIWGYRIAYLRLIRAHSLTLRYSTTTIANSNGFDNIWSHFDLGRLSSLLHSILEARVMHCPYPSQLAQYATRQRCSTEPRS